MERSDAALDRKLILMRKEQQNSAVHGRKHEGDDADLWLEAMNKDMNVVKKMLVRCALLPDFRGVEWLGGYTEILLPQALEATAGDAGKSCPAPGSTTEVSWACHAKAIEMDACAKISSSLCR